MKRIFLLISCITFIVLPSCSSNQKEKDYNVLDSIWECDYFKMSTNSNRNLTETVGNNVISVIWDIEGTSPIFLNVYYATYYEKQTQLELIEEQEKYGSEGSSVDRTFVKNGQAYIILKSDNQFKSIKFTADTFAGDFLYYDSDEEYVLKMIDTITFYNQ